MIRMIADKMALRQETAPTPTLLREPGIPPLATEDFDDLVRIFSLYLVLIHVIWMLSH